MRKILALGCLLGALAGGSAAVAQQAIPATANPSLMMVHVRAADIARSERFYTQVFGMTVTRVMGPHEHILAFPGAAPSAPGVILLLDKAGAAHNGSFLVQVPNIDAVFARVEGAGGKVTRAPVAGSAEVPLKVGFVSDPDGTRIEVIQFTAAR
jgi:predicted enzyme related to lactoylglutathione lyase